MEGIGTVAAIGGILLAVVLLWAVIKNANRSKSAERRTEQATKDLYKEIDREDEATDPDPGKF